MLHVTVDYQNQDLANRLTEMFRRQSKKTAAKALFLGVSPLALAACGGGSDSSTAQTLISGTDGNDVLPNSSANERFEGGLGDDFYTYGLSATDTIKDTGGNDTLRIVWRDVDNPRLVSDIRQDGDDLVLEMTGDANVLTVSGFFTEEGNLENVNYYFDGGDMGEGLNGKIYSLQSLENLDATYYPLIVGTEGDDNVNLSNSQTSYEIIMYTHDGDDVIFTGPSIDNIIAGAGDDSIESGDSEDYIEAGDGNDEIDGGAGDDTLDGGSGDDILDGGAGDDIVRGGDGNDTIYLSPGDDQIFGELGNDLIDARGVSGTDFMDGGEGIDTLLTGLDDEITWRVEIDLEKEYSGVEGLYGQPLMDTIKNIENVTLDLPAGRALLMGDHKDNILIAGSQADEIGGRSGSDTLTGNGGADTFVFKFGETGTDTITDFDLAEGDKLDLSSYGITTEEAAEALMSDSSVGVDVTIDGSVILTMTATTDADFAAADGWLA